MADAKHATNKSFYDRISRAYDLIADSSEQQAREAGEEALELQQGERVLEIGYGTGSSLIHLTRQVGSVGHVEGIDISSGMQSVAREKIDQEGLGDRVNLLVGDARKLPHENETFDAVFASFTIELFALDEISPVLQEVKRVLKPQGRVGIVSMATVPEGEKVSLLEKTYVWMHEHFPHIVDCQPIDVTRFVREAGFTVSKEQDMEIWTMPVRVAVGVK